MISCGWDRGDTSGQFGRTLQPPSDLKRPNHHGSGGYLQIDTWWGNKKNKPSICWVSGILSRKKEILKANIRVTANMVQRYPEPTNWSTKAFQISKLYLWVEERSKYLLGCFVLYVAASFAIFGKSCLNPKIAYSQSPYIILQKNTVNPYMTS